MIEPNFWSIIFRPNAPHSKKHAGLVYRDYAMPIARVIINETLAVKHARIVHKHINDDLCTVIGKSPGRRAAQSSCTTGDEDNFSCKPGRHLASSTMR